MRILLVNKFFYRKGGSETYLFALAEGLKALGHEVAFFAMEHPQNEDSYWSKYFVSEKDYNGDVSAFRKIHEAFTIAYSFESRKKFNRLLEEFQPDIVHLNLVHRQITFSILDAPYLKKHHVPIIYTAHDYSLICPAYTMINGKGQLCKECINGKYMNVLRNTCTKNSKMKSLLSFSEAEFLKMHRSYDKIDTIITPSRFMKNKLDEGGYSDKTVYLQNFLSRSQAVSAKKVINVKKFEEKEPYFLFFGRLSQEKGIITLIHAFLLASGIEHGMREEDSIPQEKIIPSNWTLHIVGDGPERQRIEKLIESAGSEAKRRVKVLGRKEGNMLQQEVGDARFSVLCSEWYENMPYSGLESLAAGTPIIGNNIGGIPEIVINERTGFLVRQPSVNLLADALCMSAAVSNESYKYMQKESRKYIKENCNQEKYVLEISKLYEESVER